MNSTILEIKKRFYDPQHFEVMKNLDPLAVMRDQELNMTSDMICAVCGNIDKFHVRGEVPHVTSTRDGHLNISQIPSELSEIAPGMRMSYDQLFNAYWETGNVIVATCLECNGPGIPRLEVNRHCDRMQCMGCFLCGRVTAEAAVQNFIDGCDECLGGINPCEKGRCRAWFMRYYYGYKPSPEEGFRQIEDYYAGSW